MNLMPDLRALIGRTLLTWHLSRGAALVVDGLQRSLELVPEPVDGRGESLESELRAYSLEVRDGGLNLLESEELEDLRYELFGEALACEEDYRKRSDATKRLAKLWAKEGISTMVLKGLALAQYYPEPQHRYSCDLDLFIGEDWIKGCSMLEKEGIDIDYEIYKNAMFHIDGIFVECHRFLMPIRGNKTLQRLERYLRSLLKDRIQIGDDSMFVPPLMFNALFCVEHARGHLLSEGLVLKQVCDWMVLRRQSLDWCEFWNRCDEFGLTRFAKLFDRFADWVEGTIDYNELTPVEKRVADEMFAPDISSSAGKTSSYLRRRIRLVFDKLRNGWKYREFNDVPMPVSLASQVWTHFFDKKVRL